MTANKMSEKINSFVDSCFNAVIEKKTLLNLYHSALKENEKLKEDIERKQQVDANTIDDLKFQLANKKQQIEKAHNTVFRLNRENSQKDFVILCLEVSVLSLIVVLGLDYINFFNK